MYSELLPQHYTCSNHFAEEQNLLRKNTWTFVGCLNDLEQTNSFITSTVGGKPVVVQRFSDGTLGAFSNICRHRFSLIQSQKFGIRSLTCPYHGWTYDKQGRLAGVPCRSEFPDISKRDDAKNIKLPDYKVGICGKLVFVAEPEFAPSLKEFLGGSFTRLENLSNAFGRRIDRNEIAINANWKIVVENTLEAYHVATVHENSFAKLGLHSLIHRFDGPHSSMEASLNEKSQHDFEKISKRFSSRPEIFNGYFHQMVFPAMTFASTGGLSFAVQEIEPIDENTTRFTSHVFLTTHENKGSAALENALAATITDFNRHVFEEDRDICTLVHAGTKNTNSPAILGGNEDRIKKFQTSYSEIFRQKA